MLSLDKINLNEKAIIRAINCDELFKIRLLDIGLNNGEIIQYKLLSPSKNIKAYLIKNSLIALRNCDSKKIMVEVADEKNCFNRES